MARMTHLKLGFIYLFILFALASCTKEEAPAFEQSPDERINETLSKYQALLTEAPYGWKGIVHPTGGGAYSFYFKFDNANRVVMYADFDSASAVTPRESSYRLKALQQPSLIFDTYSYLHQLSDPNENQLVSANVNLTKGGIQGVGLQSDFEYAFDTATADTIKLLGRQHSTKAFLIKATQQEAAAYSNKQLGQALLQLQNLNKILYYFKRLTIGGKVYDINLNDNAKTVSFTWVTNGTVNTFNTTFYYTTEGLVFSTPFNDGSQTITGFTGIQWNEMTSTINITVNNNTGTIAGANSPIAVDKQAPVRWWNYAASSGSYWVSLNGFHVNGVDDAYGIQSLRNGTWSYFYLIYFPQFGSNYDLFAPVFINQGQDSIDLFYGTAPRTPPTLTTDGRAIFRELGTLGPHPDSGPAALSRDQFYNASGYYFVQTSATAYDMVSAADSRIWITWEQ
jgi:hypothetical protein